MYLAPLVAGFFFAVATLLLKRAMSLGMSPWRMIFFSNLALIAVAGALFPGFKTPLEGAVWYQPILAGTVFFIGQIFSFLAVSRGDVSIATPIFGSKVIFVGLFTVLMIGESITWMLWAAAILTALSLALMAGGTPSSGRHNLIFTVVMSLLAAISYGSADVMTQKWGPLWTARSFLFYEMAICALLSFGLIPFFGQTHKVDRKGWSWLIWGSIVNALQGCLLYVAIGMYGRATEFNVLYNTRALWAIVLIWALGRWIGNHEFHAGREVVIRRVVGALLILAAVFLVGLHH
jgi:drug/metabolite transporter (DMT)-like permease